MSNKTKGILGSFLVHITIIVLLIIFGFSTPLPLPDEEGILINFGTDEMGMGITEPRPSPREVSQPASPASNERVEESPLTQNYEEAPSIPPTKPKPTPEKPKETKQQETPTQQEQTQPEEVKPREVDRRTLFPGQKTDGDDTGEGDGNVKGNQGDPDGSTESGNRTGGTEGGGDGISFSLGTRNALSLPHPDYPKQKSGRVVVEVTVDRNGIVTKAVPGVRGSTTLDSDLLKAAETAALRARFDVSPGAPAFQTGTITYVFKLQQ
jgi:outer membrane biosynthesis protein TonB